MYDKTTELYNILFERGYYNQASYLVAEELGLKMQILSSEYKLHFEDDKQQRYVFKVRLIKGGKQYTFEFGQSISEGKNEPTLYDVLTCLTKHNPDTFEVFCANYGYDNESRTAKKTYKAVLKEWKNLNRLFTTDELNLLTNIQ